MEYTRTDIPIDDSWFSAFNENRAPGLHLSDITSAMYPDAASGGDFTDADMAAYRSVGYLYEVAFHELLKARAASGAGGAAQTQFGRIISVEQIAYDGTETLYLSFDAEGQLTTPVPPGFVIMSPDGVNIDYVCPSCGRRGALEELKATYKSLNMIPAKDRRTWLVNPLAYATALDLCTIFLTVLFLAGDYRPVKPRWQRWSSGCVGETEKRENWESIVRYGRRHGLLPNEV